MCELQRSLKTSFCTNKRSSTKKGAQGMNRPGTPLRRTPQELENEFGRPHLNDRTRLVVVKRIMSGFADRLATRVSAIKELERGWVVLFIDSPGGIASQALEGVRRIKALLDPGRNPLAAFGKQMASAALFVFTACDLRVFLPGAYLLAHAPFIEKSNVPHGTLDSHRAAGNDAEATILERLVNEEVVVLLRDSHGQMPEATIRRLLSKTGGDTRLDFTAAHGYGLADMQRDDQLPEWLSSLRELQPRYHAAGQANPIQASQDLRSSTHHEHSKHQKSMADKVDLSAISNIQFYIPRGRRPQPANNRAQRALPQPPEQPHIEFTLHKLHGRHLGVREIAQMLDHYLLGRAYTRRPRWFHYGPPEFRPNQMLLLRVNCTEKQLNDEDTKLAFINSFFARTWIPLHTDVSDRATFWKSIMRVEKTRSEVLQLKMEINGDPVRDMTHPRNDAEKSARLDPVLSIWMMARCGYPLPGDCIALGTEHKTVVATKRKYRRLDSSAPLFALDCEMVLTTSGCLELARFSMINERSEVVLDTLVRPENPVKDYLTQFSGITEEAMASCKVRLADVQKQLSEMIPPNAILVGHSIEFDLRTLQISHPYCIDVARLYSFSNGNRRISLKTLSRFFLDTDIQNDAAKGHCSVEDARAALQLLQLKLEKGLDFGDVRRKWDFDEWCKGRGWDRFGTSVNEILEGLQNESAGGVEAAQQEEPGPATTTATPATGGRNGEAEDFKTAMLPEADEEAVSAMAQQAQAVDTDIVEEIPDEECFDFIEAVRYDPDEHHLSLVKQLEDTGTRNVMLAVQYPANFSQPPIDEVRRKKKRCLFFNTSGHSLQFVTESVACRTLNHDAVLAELDCADCTTSEEIDSSVRAVVDGVCQQGCVAVALCSPNKSILYMTLKPKLKPQAEGNNAL